MNGFFAAFPSEPRSEDGFPCTRLSRLTRLECSPRMSPTVVLGLAPVFSNWDKSPSRSLVRAGSKPDMSQGFEEAMGGSPPPEVSIVGEKGSFVGRGGTGERRGWRMGVGEAAHPRGDTVGGAIGGAAEAHGSLAVSWLRSAAGEVDAAGIQGSAGVSVLGPRAGEVEKAA